MLRSFVTFYGWEPALWFGVSVAVFFGMLAYLGLYAAGRGQKVETVIDWVSTIATIVALVWIIMKS